MTSIPAFVARGRELYFHLLVAAVLAASIGALVAAQAWRAALAGLGGHLPARAAWRICLVGQLGKYLPGSLWPAVMQAELAKRQGVARPTVVAAFVVSLGASLCAGAAVGALVLFPGDTGPAGPTSAVLGVFGAGFVLVLIRPDLITTVLGRAARLLRRPAPAPVPAAAVRRCLVLSVVGWVVTGAHVWVLAVSLGANPAAALPAAIGGLALATVAGSLDVLAPGGIGAREVVLVGALSTVLPLPAAAAVAAASRLVTLLGECLVAAVTTVTDRRGPVTAPTTEIAPATEGAR